MQGAGMKTLAMVEGLTIGALAERTGCNVPTIRYYEEIGLIPAAKRRPSGHRYYDSSAEELLTFIRHCRDFGFPIEQVRELVSLARSDERDCFETRDIAQRIWTQSARSWLSCKRWSAAWPALSNRAPRCALAARPQTAPSSRT
jgi:DNA-binding transcriptional MerR regulator